MPNYVPLSDVIGHVSSLHACKRPRAATKYAKPHDTLSDVGGRV